MTDDANEGMIEQLLAAGRRATRHRLEGETEQEHEALEFMDSLWDRMPRDQREKALAELRDGGLEGFADRVEREREDMEDPQ